MRSGLGIHWGIDGLQCQRSECRNLLTSSLCRGCRILSFWPLVVACPAGETVNIWGRSFSPGVEFQGLTHNSCPLPFRNSYSTHTHITSPCLCERKYLKRHKIVPTFTLCCVMWLVCIWYQTNKAFQSIASGGMGGGILVWVPSGQVSLVETCCGWAIEKHLDACLEFEWIAHNLWHALGEYCLLNTWILMAVYRPTCIYQKHSGCLGLLENNWIQSWTTATPSVLDTCCCVGPLKILVHNW